MLQVSLNDLLDYTEWQRTKWQATLQRQGSELLMVRTGRHGDGRFDTIAHVIRHIFSAERRYVERLAGRALSDTTAIALDDADTLFAFGRESRQELRRLIDTFPSDKWDVLMEFTLMNSLLRATPRKIVVHAVLHEIRHWAQVATLLRLQGVTGDSHDFLLSPILGLAKQ